jgi:hypothetical protein
MLQNNNSRGLGQSFSGGVGGPEEAKASADVKKGHEPQVGLLPWF